MTCTVCFGAEHVGKDGFCRTCRLVQRTKYPWTNEMDEQLTRIYRAAINKTDLSAALTITAKRFRRPRYIIQNRAQFLGLRIREQKIWSADEVEVLREQAGTLSVTAIAAKLGRTRHAVKHKMFSLRVSGQVVEGFSQKEFGDFLGVHHNKVSRWIDRGWLELHEDRITHDSAERFVWDHMDQYRFTACEEWWIKMMLRSGREKIGRRGPKPMPEIVLRRSA